jgi:hypothetical protein
MGRNIGFIGLGRLGLPVASLLLEAGHPVVCCKRGRSDELVAIGAAIGGDGSPRAVAEVISRSPGTTLDQIAAAAAELDPLPSSRRTTSTKLAGGRPSSSSSTRVLPASPYWS